jgi:predicted amidohydrolase YtcJ
MGRKECLLLVMLTLFTSCARKDMGISATLILRNARVWTGDDRQPTAQAVAVVGDEVVRVGSDREIDSLTGAGTVVRDLAGKLVLPGFNDSHVHFTSGGRNLLSVKLRDASSPEEFAKRIGDYARTLPKGEWILGGDWDHERWPGAPLPTRQWIDPVTPDNPVLVNRLDGHMSLANSLALKLAGVTRNTRDPEGGAVVRDASGEPTGVLKDAAAGFVDRIIPSPSAQQLRKAIQAALAEARSNGITSVQDMASPAEFAAYQALEASGDLTVRISCRTPITEYRQLADPGIRAGFGDCWLQLGVLKGFADGSLGSTTALFFSPYNDAPGTTGLPAPEMFPEGNMQKLVAAADAAHLQVTVHAIGDKANNVILNIYEEVERENQNWDRRFRIEHAQHLLASDIPRFAKLGVVAAMQPYHLIDDGRWAEKRIGKERCKTTYAFRSLLDTGAKVAFGSDWPVAPLSPVLGIYSAVTRRTLDEKNPDGWIPEQKISVAEAVKAYTWTSAYAEFAEDTKGTITPGKLADFVVLSADIFNMPPEKIEKAEVVCTIVGGRIVYEKNR